MNCQYCEHFNEAQAIINGKLACSDCTDEILAEHYLIELDFQRIGE
jgi:hypothetical protein